LTLDCAMTRRRSWAVPIAHGLEFRICRRFNNEMKFSIELSTSWFLRDLRNVLILGVTATLTEGMM